MSCLHRYRSLLLAFSALVLLLLTGANVAFDARHHRMLAVSHITSVSVGDHLAAAHGSHSNFSSDDALASNGFCDDDCDLDDQLIVPELVHVVLHARASDGLPGRTPSLRPTPSIELLRPPRAA